MPRDGSLPQKPDVFSLQSLAAWLRTKDPEEEYDYMNCDGGCLIGQYLIAVTGKSWREQGIWYGQIVENHPAYEWVASGESYRSEGHTFGAALARCEAALQQEMSDG